MRGFSRVGRSSKIRSDIMNTYMYIGYGILCQLIETTELDPPRCSSPKIAIQLKGICLNKVASKRNCSKATTAHRVVKAFLLGYLQFVHPNYI